LNLTVNSTWISVRAALTGKGHLYCAALPIEVGLQSVAQIQYFGAVSVVLAPQSASVNLTGLYPDTAYRVHCYTDAFSPQLAMPFLEALATGRPSALDDDMLLMMMLMLLCFSIRQARPHAPGAAGRSRCWWRTRSCSSSSPTAISRSSRSFSR
jgi:hypothetical protein